MSRQRVNSAAATSEQRGSGDGSGRTATVLMLCSDGSCSATVFLVFATIPGIGHGFCNIGVCCDFGCVWVRGLDLDCVNGQEHI